MPLNVTANMLISGLYDRPVTGLERPASPLAISLARAYVDGTGAGAANILYSASRTLAASANESLDLNGTALQDSFGVNIAMVRVKGIIIQARETNVTNLTVSNVTNSITTIFGTTYSLVLQPGEMLAKVTSSAAGYTITAATADLLNIANGAGTPATYDIVIIGANA